MQISMMAERVCLDVTTGLWTRPPSAVLWLRSPRFHHERHVSPSTRREKASFCSRVFSRSVQFEDFFTKQPLRRESHSDNDFIPRLVTNSERHEVQLTKTDEEFIEQGIEFVEGYEEINLESLNDLFVRVRFPHREPIRLRTALEHSYYILWIRYSKPSTRFVKKGQILGFARVLSDGAFFASIWDVAVIPAWQRSGLGRGLVERLLQKLNQDGIPVISLYAERGVVGLYEKLGFKVDPEGVTGMAYALRP